MVISITQNTLECEVFLRHVLHTMLNNNITVSDVYKQLYDGDVIKFDLTNDGSEIVCTNYRDYIVSNVSDITRTAKFIKTHTN